jgi:CheY-like chemotaxis protein
MSISVLVVEDQADIRQLVTRLLEGAGYVVHAAETPDEAIALLRTLPRPCLVLWDATTPRQSLTLLGEAILDGVHVAALPVSLASVHVAGRPKQVRKHFTSEEAILAIVEEHCPLPKTGTA